MSGAIVTDWEFQRLQIRDGLGISKTTNFVEAAAIDVIVTVHWFSQV